MFSMTLLQTTVHVYLICLGENNNLQNTLVYIYFKVFNWGSLQDP